MITPIQQLPGITAIGIVDCQRLQPSLADRAASSLPVAVQTTVTPLAFSGEATCECLTETENGSSRQTATLKFFTTDTLPLHTHIGFIVTDADGNSWLIGALEEPWPRIQATRNFGTPGGVPNCWEIEVTYTAPSALIPCIF